MAPKVTTYYHTTYARNLPEIAERGLRPSVSEDRKSLLRAVPGNLRGIYLAEEGGVNFWFNRLEEWARYDTENPVEEELVPVVLRVTTSCPVVEDPIGSRDSMYLSVVCQRHIVPGALRLWNGSKWVPVSKGVDPYKGARWVDDEDFEEGGYYELMDSYESPLMPIFDSEA
jgi:hypothetical protein